MTLRCDRNQGASRLGTPRGLHVPSVMPLKNTSTVGLPCPITWQLCIPLLRHPHVHSTRRSAAATRRERELLTILRRWYLPGQWRRRRLGFRLPDIGYRDTRSLPFQLSRNRACMGSWIQSFVCWTLQLRVARYVFGEFRVQVRHRSSLIGFALDGAESICARPPSGSLCHILSRMAPTVPNYINVPRSNYFKACSCNRSDCYPSPHGPPGA